MCFYDITMLYKMLMCYVMLTFSTIVCLWCMLKPKPGASQSAGMTTTLCLNFGTSSFRRLNIWKWWLIVWFLFWNSRGHGTMFFRLFSSFIRQISNRREVEKTRNRPITALRSSEVKSRIKFYRMLRNFETIRND